MSRHPTPNLDYIRKLYAPQDALLEHISLRLHKENIAIHIGAEEGKLLQLLIRLHGIRTLVEIGTLAGYSTLWMARALPQGGHLHTIDKAAQHIVMAREHFAQSDVADKITLHEGDAHDVLPSLAPQGPFDMVFIDADKNAYPDYLDWAEGHIRKGGLIVADNTLLFNTVALDQPSADIAPSTWKAMRLFNERLADRTRYFSTIIPTQEGLSVAIKLF
jgi:predicted O-methyltransferase YrrM